LKGISGPNPVWESGQLILSTPDAIGKALEQHLKEFDLDSGRTEIKSAIEIPDEDQNAAGFNMVESANGKTSKTMSACPECGMTLIHESGCVTCHNCGYSKC